MFDGFPIGQLCGAGADNPVLAGVRFIDDDYVVDCPFADIPGYDDAALVVFHCVGFQLQF